MARTFKVWMCVQPNISIAFIYLYINNINIYVDIYQHFGPMPGLFVAFVPGVFKSRLIWYDLILRELCLDFSWELLICVSVFFCLFVCFFFSFAILIVWNSYVPAPPENSDEDWMPATKLPFLDETEQRNSNQREYTKVSEGRDKGKNLLINLSFSLFIAACLILMWWMDSIIGQHLLLCCEFSALHHSTISSSS